jgi:hypothetical protein
MSNPVEYTWKVDYVIAIPPEIDPEELLDALNDAIIEVIEAHDSRAAGTSSIEAYHEEDD